MKRLTAILLVLFMLLPVCLTACNSGEDDTMATTTRKQTNQTEGDNSSDDNDEQNNNGNSNGGEGENDPDGGEKEEQKDPWESVELKREFYYMPESTFNKITAFYEEIDGSGTAYWLGGAPYAYGDKDSFKGKTLSSISIPVYGTKTASDGNFIFTISIFKDTPEAIANSAPLRTYPIKISAKKYGLTDNAKKLLKVITVDLTEYGITIANDELFAVASETDTLIPGYAAGRKESEPTNPILDIMMREFPQACGFSLEVGKSAWNPEMGNSLVYNFTFKEEYETKQEYVKDATIEEMLDVIKGVYGETNLSVFGDSISTLGGVSNSTKYNTTIADNAVYYSTSRTALNSPMSIEETYWGRFVTRANMNLCVNNAWSGDALSSYRYINRIQQLHNVSGDNPDLILIYFGINDASNAARDFVGDLFALLGNRGSKSEAEVIKDWLDAVIADKANYASFDFAESYAYMLYLATQKYKDAKIACVSLISNKIAERKNLYVEEYNVVIKALANYFGALYVEQGNAIKKDTRSLYMMDGDDVHPNYAGHGSIFEEIVRTLYSDIISDPNFDFLKYPIKDNTPADGYTVQSNYVPESTMDKFVGLFETYKAGVNVFSTGVAPFAFNDLESFKGKRITSITIPVMTTISLDTDGNFVFTLSIYKSDFASVQSSQAVRTIKVKIPAAENGLCAGQTNVYKFVTVDLREYNIVVGTDELIGFGANGDTLLPAYIADADCSHVIGKVMKKEFAQMCGFDKEVGRSEWDPHAYAVHSLLFDFTFETTYESKAAYEATLKEEADFQMMLEEVKKAYEGKNLSVFGDSISTFTGISTDTSYNSTIGSNEVWYKSRGTGGLYDYTYTYWGSFTRLAGMNLCVDNAWSGDSLGSGRFRTRAINLHNDTGSTPVNPDVIFVYFGINDTWGSGRDAASWKTLYDELLGLITNKYKDAKIVCVGLTTNYGKEHYPNADTLVPQYNKALKELCAKYGTLYVDQERVINASNYQSYMHDYRVLHPNAAGHELIFREIVKALYADLKN